jgi:hypothetical protein
LREDGHQCGCARMRGMEFEIPGLGREEMAAVNGNVDGVLFWNREYCSDRVEDRVRVNFGVTPELIRWLAKQKQRSHKCGRVRSTYCLRSK